MPAKPVILHPYDTEWPSRFEAEAIAVREGLGGVLTALHHIGSTSVPGLRAKPVIDMLGEVEDLGSMDALQHGMEAAGYEWWGEYGIAGRRLCVKPDPGSLLARVHLHVFATDSPEIRRHLAFRDALRRSSELAAAYESLKIELAARFPDDRDRYTDGKASFIESVIGDSGA